MIDESVGLARHDPSWHMMWSMDNEEGRRGIFRLLRTNASKNCWKFYGQSCWQLNKFTRWLERKSELPSHIKSHKLRYIVHVMRIPHNNTEASVTTGLVEGERNRGRPRISWTDNIIAWTGQSVSRLLHITWDRGRSLQFSSVRQD